MGLNKKFVKMRNDKRAEMGVGTMIIFIAMVLVAAVAASVLISTANTVREQEIGRAHV
jgi:flagellin FlaB